MSSMRATIAATGRAVRPPTLAFSLRATAGAPASTTSMSSPTRSTAATPAFRVFPHSTGSSLGQSLLAERGARLTAGVLSGSNGSPPALLLAVVNASRLSSAGDWVRAAKVRSCTNSFSGRRTNLQAGARLSTGCRATPPRSTNMSPIPCAGSRVQPTRVDLLAGLKSCSPRPSRRREYPKTCRFISSRANAIPSPRTSKNLSTSTARAGLRRVTYKVYKDARHETLNEINRDDGDRRSPRLAEGERGLTDATG